MGVILSPAYPVLVWARDCCPHPSLIQCPAGPVLVWVGGCHPPPPIQCKHCQQTCSIRPLHILSTDSCPSCPGPPSPEQGAPPPPPPPTTSDQHPVLGPDSRTKSHPPPSTPYSLRLSSALLSQCWRSQVQLSIWNHKLHFYYSIFWKIKTKLIYIKNWLHYLQDRICDILSLLA